MELQSVFINCQFTSGNWVVVHEAEYTVLDDQPGFNQIIIKDFTSLALPTLLKTMRPKRLTNIQYLELLRASVSSMPYYPVISRPI